ncbi:TIM barrel protein [Devosia nitrariae]|uniref:TIM barrel protein n=1 Tax=Devosia nitrariae TaxID=2071872 RepID=UPI0024E04904|nr:TIM barrel protein [Devosia nitrariae]
MHRNGFCRGRTKLSGSRRAAAASGFTAVEIWDWRNKPLADMREALAENDTELHTLCVETWQDKCQLGDPGSHTRFLERVRRAAEVALNLKTPKLVVLGGDRVEGRSEAAQYDALLTALDAAADAILGSGLQLLFEVVNRQFEGPNALVQDSRTALGLLRRFDRHDVRFLYDRYHAILNGEALGWAVEGNMDLVGHIQAADIPGRHEFGSGQIDWTNELSWLNKAGYNGMIGIEAEPICDSTQLYAGAQRLLRGSLLAGSI